MDIVRYRVAMPSTGDWELGQFRDVVEGLSWGLAQLGQLDAAGDQPGTRTILLCPHILGNTALAQLPGNSILYNLEQITPSSQLPPSGLWKFRHWTIWDFSPRNIERWSSLAIKAASVPIGWHPALERVPPVERKDIDVLFLGITNHRRAATLERMKQLGLKVAAPVGVFGAERDALVANAKVVVNIHYYPTSLLETLRLAYLLANGCAVVSERSARSEIPSEYEDVVCWSPYERLAETCRDLVADTGRRTALASAGRAAMRAIPVTRWLAEVLNVSAPGDNTTITEQTVAR